MPCAHTPTICATHTDIDKNGSSSLCTGGFVCEERRAEVVHGVGECRGDGMVVFRGNDHETVCLAYLTSRGGGNVVVKTL